MRTFSEDISFISGIVELGAVGFSTVGLTGAAVTGTSGDSFSCQAKVTTVSETQARLPPRLT